MKILVFEDRGSVSEYMERVLEKRGHLVIDAFNVYMANAVIETEKIDCVILDINISTEGLTSEEAELSKGGLLTGWIWFTNYALPRDLSLRERTIIYSEYIDKFQEFTKPEERKDIFLIPKQGSDSSAEYLLEKVKEINKKLNK